MAETWRRVASSSEVREGEVLAVMLGETPLALSRLNGAIYAFEDICPHQYANLSQGFVEDGEIECPLHGARFEIATGRCLLGPAESDLRMFAVRLEGDDVLVREGD